jgi:hypothetical protein
MSAQARTFDDVTELKVLKSNNMTLPVVSSNLNVRPVEILNLLNLIALEH